MFWTFQTFPALCTSLFLSYPHFGHRSSIEKTTATHLDSRTPSSEQVETAKAKVEALRVDTDDNAHAVKGDDSDGTIEWTGKHIIASLSLAGLYVGAQIPLCFVGDSVMFIARDIGSFQKASWLTVANDLAIASIAPFLGYLQDISGRRYMSLIGSVAIMIGIILVGASHAFGQAVTGISFAGAGGAIGELTALAVLCLRTAELVPVKQRGLYLGLVTFFFCGPFRTYYTWRWGMRISLIYNGVCFMGIALTYFPRATRRGDGATKMQILKSIDYVGSLLSNIRLTLSLAALPLLQGQHIVAVSFLVAFVGGMNFYSSLNFFPLEVSTVFPPDPVQVGLKALAAGLGVTCSATVVNAALSWLKGYNRELLVGSCVLMTAFGGALTGGTPDGPGRLYAFAVLSGIGIGGVLEPAATIAITVVPDELIATCVALSLSIRVVGGSIGYSIYYNIFYHKLVVQLPIKVAEAVIQSGLPIASARTFAEAFALDPAAATEIPGVTPAVLEAAAIGARWGYAYALKFVRYTSIAFGVWATIACLFLGNIGPKMGQGGVLKSSQCWQCAILYSLTKYSMFLMPSTYS
ncbi:uncharacterized protein Z519_04953 [Cladophialophora bantiana CBS 173.52]|uniref:Major facilitator superfamily (MFS) profile domain-containing protein n=1 Tax=Cladophialophora bantiana (strain ATCC 10958 / CBS 173.52 / CDC B-1940 / NIH 8579) TaxID=1442370 RepID=A0A0D2HNK1_CLAB1|nr:uncharacterized protein Z519_04953 [Cladophialophora bantiana CBS 173.52]KIW94973.1 hypothetical protein Z519_04953 [Cladophialophora bantiana CBS 173.52]